MRIVMPTSQRIRLVPIDKEEFDAVMMIPSHEGAALQRWLGRERRMDIEPSSNFGDDLIYGAW